MAHRPAPDALIVPETWFDRPVPTGLALLLRPDRRDPGARAGLRAAGDQFASSLVRGAARRPTPALAGVARTFLPPGTDARAVGADHHGGIAEVALSRRRRCRRRSETSGADAGPAGVDAAAGARSSGRCGSPSAASRSTLPGGPRRSSARRRRRVDPDRRELVPRLFGLAGGRRRRAAPSDSFEPLAARWARTARRPLDRGHPRPARPVAAVVRRRQETCSWSPVARPTGEVAPVVSGAGDLLRPAWDFATASGCSTAAPAGAGAPRRRRLPTEVDGARRQRPTTSPSCSSRATARRLVAVVRGREGDRVVASRIRHDAPGPGARVTPRRAPIAWERAARGSGHRLALPDLDLGAHRHHRRPVPGRDALRRRRARRPSPTGGSTALRGRAGRWSRRP